MALDKFGFHLHLSDNPPHSMTRRVMSKIALTENEDTWGKLWACDCGDPEFLRIAWFSKTDREDEHGYLTLLSLYQAGSLWQRLRWAFSLLFKGKTYFTELMLTKQTAREIADHLNTLAPPHSTTRTVGTPSTTLQEYEKIVGT